jgi:membrane-associated protease RseP (regulator of RpoE activity)
LGPPAWRPTARTWIKHLILLLITFITATIAGTLYPFGLNMPFPAVADPQSWPEFFEFIARLPSAYLALIANAVYQIAVNPEYLKYGLSFSLSLLFILTSHEMGHYIACRIYGVDATLPYFIPTPPMVGPAGTFGAFIKIRSPMPSRKAVFDIGVAGPIAGFIALIPIAVIGLATMQQVDPHLVSGESSIVFSDPLFMRMLGLLFGIDPSLGIGNAFYFAAWVGLLVTALNLIPSGQLDGGHAIYAALGPAVHRWSGRVAFVLMAVLSIVGWFVFNSPSGFLIAVLLGVMMRVRHPEPWDQQPLDLKRRIVAVLTVAIFVLCFVPFPIQIT